MGRARTARGLGAAAAAACLVLACSLRGGGGARRDHGGGPAAQPLRIWMAPLLRWEAGAERRVEFALENPTNRTVAMAAPDPAHARVAVLMRPDGAEVCGVAPRADAAPEERVELAPGDRVAIRVDLAEACAGVPPGDYRLEVSYRAPEPGSAAPAGDGGARPAPFAGIVATAHGEVVVVGGPSPSAGAPARAARRPLLGR